MDFGLGDGNDHALPIGPVANPGVRRGGPDDDTITGGSADDDLLGDDGIDILSGGAGLNNLRGGPGRDVLDGSGGRAAADYTGSDSVHVRPGPREPGRADRHPGRDRHRRERRDRRQRLPNRVYGFGGDALIVTRGGDDEVDVTLHGSIGAHARALHRSCSGRRSDATAAASPLTLSAHGRVLGRRTVHLPRPPPARDVPAARTAAQRARHAGLRGAACGSCTCSGATG